MAITGAHFLLYSREAEALRAVLRDVLNFPCIDAGRGWLIFALPPAEMGIHPSEGAPQHQLSFLCDDLSRTISELRAKGIVFDGEPQELAWGIVITMVLPGDVRVMLYQPKHPLAIEL